jgi:hypothetical protein
MNKQELKSLIREEIKKALNEQFDDMKVTIKDFDTEMGTTIATAPLSDFIELIDNLKTGKNQNFIDAFMDELEATSTKQSFYNLDSLLTRDGVRSMQFKAIEGMLDQAKKGKPGSVGPFKWDNGKITITIK